MSLTNKSPVQDRLAFLQQADGHRSWHSLEDGRFCVRCLKIFNGHALRIARRDAGHYEVLCPTAGCDSSPLHCFTMAVGSAGPDPPGVPRTMTAAACRPSRTMVSRSPSSVIDPPMIWPGQTAVNVTKNGQ